MEKEITKTLDELNLSKELKGYQYLHTAIDMTAQEPRTVLDGIGKLYEAIAKKYGTTPRGVALAICSLVEKAWFYGDIDVLNSYFGYTINNSRGKPTTPEFIAMIADKVRIQNENNPLKTDVTRMLHQLGIPASIFGHDYLRTAIMMAVKEPTITEAMIGGLCKSVAREHQSSEGHVYSAMRRAIEIAWDRGDEYTRDAYFEDTVIIGDTVYTCYNKPTPSKFISVIADKLRAKHGAQ